MPAALIIFDCDGVLVDSERIAVSVAREALAELGWQLSDADILKHFMGRSTADMAKQIEAKLARSIGVNPHDCVVIEDSPYGLAAAQAAEMRAFGYVGGMLPRSFLEGFGATLFDDMHSLPTLLEDIE